MQLPDAIGVAVQLPNGVGVAVRLPDGVLAVWLLNVLVSNGDFLHSDNTTVQHLIP